MALKTDTLTIKVTAEEKARVKELAKQKNVTVSKLLHAIIFQAALKEKKND